MLKSLSNQKNFIISWCLGVFVAELLSIIKHDNTYKEN